MSVQSKSVPLWCPICDVPSKECTQPEREEIVDDRLETGEEIIYWSEGHSGHWITLAERKQDEALENYSTNRSTLECTEALGANAVDRD